MASTNKTGLLELNLWEAQDKPQMADFNEDNRIMDETVGQIIEENGPRDERISQLEQEVDRLDQGLNTQINNQGNVATLYVRVSGDDGAGDGTTERPFASLGRALIEARQYNGGQVSISLGDGTYREPEALTLYYLTSFVSLHSESQDRDKVTVELERLTVAGTRLQIKGITLLGKTDGQTLVYAPNGSTLTISDTRLIGQGASSTGVRVAYSIGYLSGSEYRGFQSVAILASEAATVRTSGNTGAGNVVALHANGAKIINSGTIPGADTPVRTANGGEVTGV